MAPTICKLDDPHLVFVRIGDATTPPEGLIEHIKNKHWIAHPDKGLAFWRRHPKDPDTRLSLWCNSNPEITKSMLPQFPWAEVRFMPSVFRKINPHDY